MILLIVAGGVSAFGLFSILSRKSLLGLLIGIQILMLGASMAFIFGGIVSGSRLDGHVVSLLVEMGGVGLVVAGYALAVRLFYLKGNVNLSEVRSLKR